MDIGNAKLRCLWINKYDSYEYIHCLTSPLYIGDKVFSGVLGGCCLVNLTIFDDVHKAIILPEKAVAQGESFKGREGCQLLGERYVGFYKWAYLHWKNLLNYPIEIFMDKASELIEFRNQGDESREDMCRWQKEWEETALSEEVYMALM